ncbi:gp55 [Burkholderia phage BcepB1A]|nr:gp55 [Burkholderia phage BcepB1A]AAY87924.1 gp55 [Burkholderia phage BcepB1A]
MWFERTRVEFRGRRAHWSKWVQIPRRPDHAWYNPAAGRARLPKD